ncbi:hypothetical protein MKZ38_006793 [Zalerion maritima]|uniref:Uncharacterized protein n=1 Tax=Zalerion maritima TaxID=339359 RepID=A0AAD5WTV4_9PEZI|nr:hypothetical protein MKZ38_006793 [Zalerion maritima]
MGDYGQHQGCLAYPEQHLNLSFITGSSSRVERMLFNFESLASWSSAPLADILRLANHNSNTTTKGTSTRASGIRCMTNMASRVEVIGSWGRPIWDLTSVVDIAGAAYTVDTKALKEGLKMPYLRGGSDIKPQYENDGYPGEDIGESLKNRGPNRDRADGIVVVGSSSEPQDGEGEQKDSRHDGKNEAYGYF